MNTRYLIPALLSLALATTAFAVETQKIECKDKCTVKSPFSEGCDVVRFETAGDDRGDVVWTNSAPNAIGGQNDVQDQGTLTLLQGESKKHPGYVVYAGGNDEGSAQILFELPKDLVGKSAPARFTGYFNDTENDGGPDVPFGITMDCSIE